MDLGTPTILIIVAIIVVAIVALFFVVNARLVLQPEIVTLLVRDGAGERTRAATGDDPVVCGQPKITRWPQATA